jgi:MFS transporter, UMF1 family
MAGFFPAFFQQYWSLGVDRRSARSGSARERRRRLRGRAARAAARRDRRPQRPAQALPVAWSLLGIAAPRPVVRRAGRVGGRGAAVHAGASIGFWGGNVFYDALLLDVASPANYDRVSASAIRSATSAAACCSRSTC